MRSPLETRAWRAKRRAPMATKWTIGSARKRRARAGEAAIDRRRYQGTTRKRDCVVFDAGAGPGIAAPHGNGRERVGFPRCPDLARRRRPPESEVREEHTLSSRV